MSNKKLPPGWEKQNSNDRPNWVYKDSLKKSWNNNASNLMSNPNYKVDISEETKNIVSDKSKKNSLEEKFASNKRNQNIIKEENKVLDENMLLKEHEIVDDKIEKNKTFQAQDNVENKAKKNETIPAQDNVENKAKKNEIAYVNDSTLEKEEKIDFKKSRDIVKKEKKIFEVVLMILLIITIIALAVLVYLYFNDKKLKIKLVDSTVVETSTIEPTTITDDILVETTTVEETTTTEDVVSTNNENMSTDGILLTTEYYTITLPSWWKGKYGYEIYETENYGYSLTVYHKQSKEEYYSGEFFTICLITHNSEEPMNLVYLGNLSVPNINDFYIYAHFPTDVQYSESVANEYIEMQDEVNNILLTISPGNGNAYTSADFTETDESSMTNSENEIMDENENNYMNENKNILTDGISLKTEYYTITLPSWWKGKYGYEIYETEGHGYSLTVYHKQSGENYYGGELFSIDLVLHDSKVSTNSIYLGDLSVPQINDFYIYALFPIDAQYSESEANEYMEMQDEVDNILLTISSRKGSMYTSVD